MTDTTTVLAALRQRLRAVADVLIRGGAAAYTDPMQETFGLLDELVSRVRSTLRPDEAWLVWFAVAGHLPLAQDVVDFVRHLELAGSVGDAERWLLHQVRGVIGELGHQTAPVRVLTDAVLVDASFSAQFDKHTGIQRVTREVCSRWMRDHEVTILAWTPGQRALRTLSPVEAERVLAWSDAARGTSPERIGPLSVPEGAEIVVPWRGTLVLPEVPKGRTTLPLAALAQYSATRVAAIGYDAIPVVSADLRPLSDADEYVAYLTMIKHADRVAGISASAAAEFAGFADAVRAQGLPGPEVTEVLLAAEVPETGPAQARPTDGVPTVLCVGSHEPHKNHVAVLHAAELLWREGLDFTLDFVGGPGWDTREFDETADRLIAAGRAVSRVGSVTDSQLWQRYREAAFTVFPSLHEGYGLPVAESLACGTPVITTEYGSTGEIARGGGCLLVDPRDDLALRDAMRRLLSEPETLDSLRAEARSVPRRSWDVYAVELWQTLVEDSA